MIERHGSGQDAPGANLPATSLIICSRNRPQLLWETIQSILKGDEIPTEMIIVDQSEMPNPRLENFQPERACKFHYLWSEEKGVSLARNLAASKATYPILVFTDDDMLATPTWFGSLVRALLAVGPRGVVTGQVLAEADNHEGRVPSTRNDNQAAIYRGRVERDVLFTGNMIIYRSVFDDVGGFDTRLGPGTLFPAAEDNDFAFRLLETGYSIVYDPYPKLYHRVWRSRSQSLWLYWSYGCGQGGFYAKYFSAKDIYMMKRMARDLGGYLLRFPYRIVWRRNQAWQDLFFVAGLLYGAARWRIKRRRMGS
jgi:GT2 family glycosyltransferase